MNLIVILIALAVVIIFTIIAGYNGIIGAKNNVIEALSSIDVMLKNRFDLMPNVISAVKTFMTHEKDMMVDVTKLRTQMMDAPSGSKEYFDAGNQMSATLKSLFAVAENYPDLKSNENFLNLQNQLERMEDKLQAARRTYNAAVKDLRNRKEQFPTNIIAGYMSVPSYDMFEVDESERANINVADMFSA